MEGQRDGAWALSTAVVAKGPTVGIPQDTIARWLVTRAVEQSPVLPILLCELGHAS
jgi:hypothetical protein